MTPNYQVPKKLKKLHFSLSRILLPVSLAFIQISNWNLLGIGSESSSFNIKLFSSNIPTTYKVMTRRNRLPKKQRKLKFSVLCIFLPISPILFQVSDRNLWNARTISPIFRINLIYKNKPIASKVYTTKNRLPRIFQKLQF